MTNNLVIKIIIITGSFFPPLWGIHYFYYHNWKQYPSDDTAKKLGIALQASIIFVLLEILMISFLLFQYGRNFIHVLGTFY